LNIQILFLKVFFFKKIINNPIKIYKNLIINNKIEAQDLINHILKVDPKKRCNMEYIKNHRWTCEGFDGPPDSYLEPRPPVHELDEEIIEELLT